MIYKSKQHRYVYYRSTYKQADWKESGQGCPLSISSPDRVLSYLVFKCYFSYALRTFYSYFTLAISCTTEYTSWLVLLGACASLQEEEVESIDLLSLHFFELPSVVSVVARANRLG